MKKTISRTIRIDEETDDALQRQAVSLGVSYSEALRRAVIHTGGVAEKSAESKPEAKTSDLPKPTSVNPCRLDGLPDPLRGGLNSSRR